MATAGSIVISLELLTGLFETDTARAEKSLKSLQKTAKAAGAALGVAIVAGATAATVALKKSIDGMDELSKAAQRVGLPTEAFSALAYAGNLADVSIEDLQTTLGKLTRSQAAALEGSSKQAQIFKDLGISVKDASGNLREADDVLGDFAEAFKRNQGSPEIMAAGFDIFGKSFQKIIPLIKDGKQGLADATDEASRFGAVISTEAGRQAEEFNDNLERMKGWVKGLANQVAADLLPDLKALTGDFLAASTKGDALAETAHQIGDAFRFTSDLVSSFVANVRGLTFDLIALGNAFLAVNKASRLDFSGAKESYANAKDAYELARLEQKKIDDIISGKARLPKVLFSDSGVIPESMLKPIAQPDLDYRPSGGSGKKGSAGGGKSDATRQAEEAAKAMREALDAQAAWHDKILDMAADLEGPAATVLRDYDKSMADLTGQFNEGKVRLDDYAKAQDLLAEIRDKDLAAIKAQLTPFQEVNAAIAEQTMLVGMSADQQEIWNNLKWAGVTADSALGKQITESTKDLQRQRDAMGDQIELMDSVRDAGADFFTDWVGGSKSFKDAALDAFESIHQKILQMIAENLMDQLFGKQGQPAGGSTGGWMSAIMGLFGGMSGGSTASSAAQASGDFGIFNPNVAGFGGGYAGGGDILAKRAYLVGEHGPEMFVPRTAGTVLTAGQTAERMGSKGRGITNNNTFHLAAPTDPRSQSQIAQKIAQTQRMAEMRNR